MSVLRYYDTGSGQWLPVVSGAQGIQGTAGFIGSNGIQGIQGIQGGYAPNAPMNYAQNAPASRITGVTSGSTVLSVSITTTGNPVLVGVYGDANNTSTALIATLQLYRGTTALGNITNIEGSAANENQEFSLSVIDAPAAGTYTYSLKLVTSNVNLDFGETGAPVIWAVELTGKIGVQGLTGIQGAAGFVGSNGAQGIQGYTGAQGISGSNGVQGFQGTQGVQGLTGLGVQGIQGFTGPGVQGIQGPAGYVNATPGKTVTTFTATSGQTTFSTSYTVGYIDVFLNGVRLSAADYTATNGTSVVLASGAAAGDTVDIVQFVMGIGAQGIQGTTGATPTNYQTIAYATTAGVAGTTVTQRPTLNFLNATITDDSANNQTTVTINSSNIEINTVMGVY